MEELNQVRWKESYCSNEGLKKNVKENYQGMGFVLNLKYDESSYLHH